MLCGLLVLTVLLLACDSEDVPEDLDAEALAEQLETLTEEEAQALAEQFGIDAEKVDVEALREELGSARTEPSPTATPEAAALTSTPGPPTDRAAIASPTPIPLPQQATTEQQREALVAIYHALDGPNWTINQWPVDGYTSLSNWPGIRTDANGNVTYLDLGASKAEEKKGQLPPEIGLLTSLTKLDLRGLQHMTGPLPPEMGNLTALRILWVQGSRFTGNIPKELGNLTNLEDLRITGNHMTGVIPLELGNLQSLTSLSFENTRLCMPEELQGRFGKWDMCREYPALVAIYHALDGPNWTINQWPVDGYTSLSNWPGIRTDANGNVTYLDLGASKAEEKKGQLPPEIGLLTSLTKLDLRGLQHVTGPLPPEMGNLTALRILWVQGSRFTGNIPKELGNLTNLEDLRITGNHMTGVIPLELGNLQSLTSLSFENTRLCMPEELQGRFGKWDMCREYPALVAIYHALDGPNWTINQWPVDGYTSLSNWPGIGTDANGNVIYLDLGASKAEEKKGQLPPEIGLLTSLTKLDLRGLQHVTGPLPPEMGNLTALRILWVQGSRFTGNIPKELGNLTNLEDLRITGNHMTGVIPLELGNLQSLTSLSFENTRLCMPEELQGRFGKWDMCREYPALVAIHKALDGPNWTINQWPIDGYTSLSNWPGIRTDENGNVTYLDLGASKEEEKKGQLPPEIGLLTSLTKLDLRGLQHVTGCIPVRLRDHLTSLSSDVLTYCDGTEAVAVTAPVVTPPPDEPTTPGGMTEPEHDRATLITLYNATGGPSSWTVKWPVDSDPAEAPISEWYGVTLDPAGRVAELNLTGNGLTGPMPEELGNLAALTKLQLGENNLSGRIPDSLGRVTFLRWLTLSENRLTGGIPSTLGNLGGLQYLFLNDNQLTGKMPVSLGGLSLLRTFIAGGNSFKICFPWGLMDVERHDLDDYGLGYCGAEEVEADRKALIKFYNDSVGDTGPWRTSTNWNTEAPLGDWYGVTTDDATGRVIQLRLANNGIGGGLRDDSLGRLTELSELDLSNNDLTHGIPPSLGDLAELRVLNLGGNTLQGVIPSSLGNLTQLRTLDLNWNDLEWPVRGMWEGGSFQELRTLDLSSNDLAGTIPEELANLSKLEVLELDANELRGLLPVELGMLSKLRTLRLEGNSSLEGCIPDVLAGQLTNFDGLLLCGTRSDRQALVAFYNATGGNGWYASWDVDNEDGDIGQWSGVTVDERTGRVVKLELAGKNLHESIPTSLARLSMLTHLDLSGNELGGTIPAELGSLTNLVHLDLSDNELGGPLAPELDLLTNLTHLNLSGNALRGDIKDQNPNRARGIDWANLQNLVEVDLSSNKRCGGLGCQHGLSGWIPYAFSQMPNLEYLDLSGNELNGGAKALLENAPQDPGGEGDVETTEIILKDNPWDHEQEEDRGYWQGFEAEVFRQFVELAKLEVGRRGVPTSFEDAVILGEYKAYQGLEARAIRHLVKTGKYQGATTWIISGTSTFAKVIFVGYGWVSFGSAAGEIVKVVMDLAYNGLIEGLQGMTNVITYRSVQVAYDSCLLDNNYYTVPRTEAGERALRSHCLFEAQR